MGGEQTVRVFAFGQKDKSQRATGAEQRQGALGSARGRVATGRVTVEAKHGLCGQAPERSHLLLAQGRAKRSYSIVKAGAG